MKGPQESTWEGAVYKKMIGPRCYVVVSGGRTYRRNRRQLRMVPITDFHPVAKAAAEPLQSVPQTDPPPVGEPASEHVEVAPPPIVTRSGRIAKPPAHFQEFAT